MCEIIQTIAMLLLITDTIFFKNCVRHLKNFLTSPSDKVSILIKEKQKEKPNMSYRDIFIEVQKEDMKLAKKLSSNGRDDRKWYHFLSKRRNK